MKHCKNVELIRITQAKVLGQELNTWQQSELIQMVLDDKRKQKQREIERIKK